MTAGDSELGEREPQPSLSEQVVHLPTELHDRGGDVDVFEASDSAAKRPDGGVPPGTQALGEGLRAHDGYEHRNDQDQYPQAHGAHPCHAVGRANDRQGQDAENGESEADKGAPQAHGGNGCGGRRCRDLVTREHAKLHRQSDRSAGWHTVTDGEACLLHLLGLPVTQAGFGCHENQAVHRQVHDNGDSNDHHGDPRHRLKCIDGVAITTDLRNDLPEDQNDDAQSEGSERDGLAGVQHCLWHLGRLRVGSAVRRGVVDIVPHTSSLPYPDPPPDLDHEPLGMMK